MRILWSSNAPWAATGYGNQTRLFTQRIKALGNDVAIQAWYGVEGSALNWDGMPVLPRLFHPYGQDILGAHAVQFAADIVITLIDAWVMEPDMYGPRVRWCPWFPVDMAPIPPPVVAKVARAWSQIVYSQFGLAEARKSGLDPAYVPHGVDTKVFKPINKRTARETMGWPQDAFIVGMVAANKGNTPSRKSFPQHLEAFAQLHRKHPDTVLYLHTNKSEHGELQGVNLPMLVEALGLTIGKDVLFVDAYAQIMGLPDEKMVAIYSGLDVLMNVSMGEGFGIPIVEAQACGTPVITGDWTAMPEVTFGGWMVTLEEAEKTWTPLGAYQFTPHIGAITDRLEEAYNSRAILGPKCRAGAERYDADRVTQEYWLPLLERLAERVETSKAPAGHAHKWAPTSIYINRKLHAPCLAGKCDSGRDQSGAVTPGMFPSRIGDLELDIEDDPDGGVSKFVMRECVDAYHLDTLDLKPGDAVVDIGAHVGVVSVYLAKKYGVRVHAFEPVKENYDRLLHNVAANGVESLVTSYNMAVTGDGREVHLPAGSKTNSGGLSIYQSQNGTVAQSMTLAQILEIVGPVALLKIDCEGAEYEILEGHLHHLDGVKRLVGEVHFNNTFFRERMAALMRDVAQELGPNRVCLTETQMGDLPVEAAA